MSTPAFKEFIKTPKGKLVLALCAMLLSWIFLFLNFAGSATLALPSEAKKAEIKQQIRKLRTELQGLKEKQAQADRLKKRWEELAMSSWHPSINGDPELQLRQIVENAAKKSELKLNNLGTVRINRVNQDFSFAELDVSGNTRLAPLTNFVYEIQKVRPCITWRRFSIFVMMRRPRPGNNRTAFSGGLQFLQQEIRTETLREFSAPPRVYHNRKIARSSRAEAQIAANGFFRIALRMRQQRCPVGAIPLAGTHFTGENAPAAGKKHFTIAPEIIIGQIAAVLTAWSLLKPGHAMPIPVRKCEQISIQETSGGMMMLHLFVAEIRSRMKCNTRLRMKMIGKTHAVDASFRKHSRREMPFVFPAKSGARIPEYIRLDLHADPIPHGERGKAGIKEKCAENRHLLPVFPDAECHFQMFRLQLRCLSDHGGSKSGSIFHLLKRTAIPVETQVQFPRVFPADPQRILSAQDSRPETSVLQ